MKITILTHFYVSTDSKNITSPSCLLQGDPHTIPISIVDHLINILLRAVSRMSHFINVRYYLKLVRRTVALDLFTVSVDNGGSFSHVS